MTNTLLQHPFRAATILLIAVIGGALLSYGLTVDGAQAAARGQAA